jgi:hypothetical protein
MLDTQGIAIANELFMDLGAWLDRQQKRNIPKHRRLATLDLRTAGHDARTLRMEWDLQVKDQLSVKHRSFYLHRRPWPLLTYDIDSPSKLQNWMDRIWGLQDDIQSLEHALNESIRGLGEFDAPEELTKLLGTLHLGQETYERQLYTMYQAANLSQYYPELAEILPRDVLCKLVLCHDVKEVIRRKAQGRIAEQDSLDRAAKGVHNPIGNLHSNMNFLQDI